jgi:hypothetical protein
MKTAPFYPCLALVSLVKLTLAQTPNADENLSLTAERTAIRAAAQSFCTELRREPIRGLPTAAQLQRLSSCLTPELVAIFERARFLQQEQMKRHPEDKPHWIEGDLFSSLFEGVSSWTLEEVFSAPTVDATVQVQQTYSEPNPEPVTWTDTLVFKKREQKWLLDDIRMGGDWAFKSGSSLRDQLPGGIKEDEDHETLSERWRVKFTRDGDVTTQVTVEAVDGSVEPFRLFGGEESETCPMPCWVVWSPNEDLIALRLGEGPRNTRTVVYRWVGRAWQPVLLPEFYPQERQTLLKHGFRERDRLLDGLRWQDANTLVVAYFGLFEKGEEGDGFHKWISVRVDAQGGTQVVEAIDAPGEP